MAMNPKSNYEKVYQAGGYGYDSKVDTWRTWVQKHYIAEFDLTAGMRLLDVGCGDGFWAMLLAEHGIEVTGVDQAAAAIESARQRLPDMPFVLADVSDPLPPIEVLKPESFEVAFMRGFSLFGSPDIGDEATHRQLTNIARMVRPGGMLLASSYSDLSGMTSAGSVWVNHRVSTIVAAIEKVADPFKIARAGNYLQVGARRRDLT
jgi:ubiquinone/menaquinone biosynthesis C-methylase UbiE